MRRLVTSRRTLPGFGNFLFSRRRRHRASQEEVGKVVGFAGKTVSEYERNDYPFSGEQLKVLADHFGEDPAEWLTWLPSDEPDQIPPRADQAAEVSPARSSIPSQPRMLITGEVHGDTVVEAEGEAGEFSPALHDQADTGVVRVRGYSMMPAVMDGDYLGLSRRRAAAKGEIVVARRGNEVYLKRLAEKRGRFLRLESDNPVFAPIEGDDIKVIAVVVWTVRGGR